MFGTYFYNKNIRNVVILFGTVFNDIIVRRVTSAGATQEEFRVPIAYGPSEKFLVRLREATDISKGKVGLTLPRMSFDFISIVYDTARKLQTTKRYKKIKSGDNTKLTTIYNPVPYNFDFTLSVMVKNSDDGTQILEQILPYFTPEYQVTMNEMSTMGIKRDIPIIFTGLSTEDSYEGDFLTRRALIHTLTFVVQGFMYGPTSDVGIIREVDVNEYDGLSATAGKLSNLDVKPDPLTADPDDDYGYTTTQTDNY